LRESEAAAEGFVCAKAQRQQQHDVGHEGVITGLMLLAFVPLSLIPEESPSRNEDQLIYGIHFNNCHPQLLVMSLLLSVYLNKRISYLLGIEGH